MFDAISGSLFFGLPCAQLMGGASSSGSTCESLIPSFLRGFLLLFVAPASCSCSDPSPVLPVVPTESVSLSLSLSLSLSEPSLVLVFLTRFTASSGDRSSSFLFPPTGVPGVPCMTCFAYCPHNFMLSVTAFKSSSVGCLIGTPFLAAIAVLLPR